MLRSFICIGTDCSLSTRQEKQVVSVVGTAPVFQLTCLGLVWKGRMVPPRKAPSAQTLHLRMRWDVLGKCPCCVCVSKCSWFFPMLSILVPFSLKMEAVNESASPKLFTILNSLLPVKDKFGDLHLCLQRIVLFMYSGVVCKRCNDLEERSALMNNCLINILRFEWFCRDLWPQNIF